MKTIRNRTASETKPKQQRKRKISYGIYVYGIVFTIFVFWVLRVTLGDYFLLQAPGEVVAETAAVESLLTARVEEMLVEPGDQVEVGDVLLRVSSIDYQMEVASMSGQLANLHSAMVSSVNTTMTARQLLPVINAQIRDMEKRISRHQALRNQGLTTENAIEDERRQLFELHRKKVQLEIEAANPDFNDRQVSELERRLRELDAIYVGGKVRAPLSGTIGLDSVKPGEVLNRGERFLTLNISKPYVIAFLPHRYQCNVTEGMLVDASTGKETASGRVVELLPLAGNMKEEIRAGLSIQSGHGQVAKIALDDPKAFPIGQKVTVEAQGEYFCAGLLGNLFFGE